MQQYFRKIFRWLRENLFSSWWSGFTTIFIIWALYHVLPFLWNWVYADASFLTKSARQCVDEGYSGACWGFIPERWKLFLFYLYPTELLWRPILAFLLLFVALVPIFKNNFQSHTIRKKLFYFTAAYPILAYWLIGGGLGLEPVSSYSIGGFMLNILVGILCIVISFPLSILVALTRRSSMPILSKIAVGFVEIVRGIPLVMLILVASTMLNYFLPVGGGYSLLFRVVIMITLFATVYLSEVFRGGLNGLDKGQYDAANAIGLNYWQSMGLIILPQVIKNSIPSIVNIFIGMLMDTTLVAVVSMYDALGAGKATLVTSDWKVAGREVALFVAVLFFICCFAMSRFSAHLEKKLAVGQKH